MSLIKQLWLAIVVILSLAFAGGFALSTVASKHYFEQQLQARLIQDTIRKALADELLFGKLANGGSVHVDLDDKDEVKLTFESNKSKQDVTDAETALD